MTYNRPIKVNRGPRKKPVWPLLALLAAALVVALIVAVAWQTMGADTPSSSAPPVSSTPAPSEPEPSSSEPEPEPEPASEPPMPEGAMPETERVKSDYFDDAVFVGDSITSGIELYGVMSNADVLAETGMNLSTVYSKEVIKQEDGTRIPIMAALEQKQYGKVYLMLGGNEVRDEEKSLFIEKYGKFIDDVRALQPDAVVYVQSILPVTKDNKYNMDNTRIDDFNAALIELCVEKQVYFLNIAEKMKDENGRLPTEASPADGMHFGPDYYQIWFNYLKTHVAGQELAAPETSEEQQVLSSQAQSSERNDLETISS